MSESEARYRSALKAGRMGSWETDLVANTRIWSAEGMALFGLTLPEGRGQVGGPHDEYQLALHPDDRHLVERFHRRADSEDSFPADYRIVRPDGAVLWLSGRGLVVSRQPDGKAHRLVSIMADVSERRQAEESLKVERERLELALTAGRMGAFDLDMRTHALWWSAQMYAIFGLDPARFTPTQQTVGALLHDDDREEFLRERAAAIERREPFSFEMRIRRGDGSQAWIGYRGQTAYDDAGTALRHFGIAMDITERKHAEQALRDADRKKDHFIATLAHELRNPLAPIRNAVTLLRRSEIDDPKVVWSRDVIDRQVSQMTHLLEDLLDVSRMALGRFQLRQESLDIATVLERAIEIARPAIDAAGHRLDADGASRAVFVQGDLTRLTQAFSNLLINAAKFTRGPGVITLSTQPDADHVVVRVTDTGIGLGAGEIPQIFETFGQPVPALDRPQGGLGLGLPLARRVIEMHGGAISAHSEGAGRGSEFRVRLPLQQTAVATGEPETAEPSSAVGARLRILVADDLADSADSLALLLESMGHAVCVAYDGEEALRVGASFRPDVALLDIGMPKLNGYDTCRSIREAPWGAEVTLVAQTGWGQSEDRRRSEAAGFHHHVVKPVDVRKLAAWLQTVRKPTGATP